MTSRPKHLLLRLVARSGTTKATSTLCSCETPGISPGYEFKFLANSEGDEKPGDSSLPPSFKLEGRATGVRLTLPDKAVHGTLTCHR